MSGRFAPGMRRNRAQHVAVAPGPGLPTLRAFH